MFERIRSDCQCLVGYSQNSNVWKDTVWKDRAKIPTFKTIRQQFQCFEGSGQNYGVWKDKVKIRMFEIIRTEFQCLTG